MMACEACGHPLPDFAPCDVCCPVTAYAVVMGPVGELVATFPTEAEAEASVAALKVLQRLPRTSVTVVVWAREETPQAEAYWESKYQREQQALVEQERRILTGPIDLYARALERDQITGPGADYGDER